MQATKPSVLFRLIRGCVQCFYPKTRIEGTENLPQEPVIFVGNHSQMHGPIVAELYLPGQPYIWCAGEMMQLKEVPAYAFRDFWSRKPKWTKPFYKLLSYIIAPFSVCIFNNARTIGVYHDTRILSTFKKTLQHLQSGSSIVIFPEHDEPHNHIICDFQDKFIDIAKLYYKKTGKELQFIPMYIAPKRRCVYLGKATSFRADQPMETERRRICEYLMEEITAMAQALPSHTVVPYQNIPKNAYPTNHAKEDRP